MLASQENYSNGASLFPPASLFRWLGLPVASQSRRPRSNLIVSSSPPAWPRSLEPGAGTLTAEARFAVFFSVGVWCIGTPLVYTVWRVWVILGRFGC